jgi:hypothetical protein
VTRPLSPEASPLVTRRYFVMCKNHVTWGGHDGGRSLSAGEVGCKQAKNIHGL